MTIGKPPAEPGARLSVLTGHIGRKIALSVFASTIALMAVVMVPGYERLRAHFHGSLERQAAGLFNAAVDPRSYPSLQTLAAIGDNLASKTPVTGGTFVTGIGETAARFGEAPELTWVDARVHGLASRAAPDFSRIDVFIGPERTGLAYGVILRLDAGARWAAVRGHLVEAGVLVLICATSLTLVIALLVANQVLRPLAAIRETVDFALNEPEAAQTRLSALPQRDEIGQLSRAVDQLLFLTSATFEDELASARAIIDNVPHGILSFSQDGHLMSANAAALGLFSAPGADTLVRRGPDALFRFDGVPASAAELLADGPVSGHGEIISPEGDVPCLIGGDTVVRRDGTVLRMFLVFVDMRALVEDVRREVRSRHDAEAAVRRLETELVRMRRLFEACLVLVEIGRDDTPRPRPVTIDLEAVVTGRLGAAAANCVISGLLPVTGDPDEVRRLVAHAIQVVQSRSDRDDPGMEIVGTAVDDGMLTITIFETSAAGEGERVRSIGAAGDTTLLMGSVATLARRQGGRMEARTIGEAGNAVAFTLPLDRLAMEEDDATGGTRGEAA